MDWLTINVTEFYRDRAQWERLRREILPQLLKESPRPRIWSAGCSNGAEPYSVAMLLDEAGSKTHPRILSTDSDERMLAMVDAGGPYTERWVRDLPEDLRDRYMIQDEEKRRWSMQPDLQRRLPTRTLDLLKDPFGARYDLIICRNVVIYFEDYARDALYERFLQALRPGGLFFIGSSETIPNTPGDSFERLGGHWYRRPPRAHAGRTAA